MLSAAVKPVAITLALLGSAAHLGGVPLVPQDTGRDPKLVVEAGGHDLSDLIERAATFLQRNYLFHESEFAGNPNLTISLQNRLALDAEACEEVVSQFAFSRGFAIVPIDEDRRIYEVINMQGPRRAEIGRRAVGMTPEQVLRTRKNQIPVFCTVPLTHLSAVAATNALRPFLAQGGGGHGSVVVGHAGHPGAILLHGFAGQVAATIDMLRAVDMPNEHADKQDKALEARLAKLEKRLAALETGGK